MLQSRDSIDGPTQFLPPFLGGGFLHFRRLYCTPPPQVLLQEPYCPHGVQPPSTEGIQKESIGIVILKTKVKGKFALCTQWQSAASRTS